jgi:hypothetical protein
MIQENENKEDNDQSNSQPKEDKGDETEKSCDDEIDIKSSGDVQDKPSVEDGEDEDDNTALYKQHDWQLEGIKEPHENDVLYGRGGGTNHHPGNKRYRKHVEEKKVEYVNSKRLEKPLVALNIIRNWRREQVPPGRFLKINDKTGLWDDVGDKKAREKTSQALREKAPVLRKQQDEQESELLQHQQYNAEEGFFDETDIFDEGDGGGYTPLQVERKEVVSSSHHQPGPGFPREKSTRFANGTKSPAPSKNITRPSFGNRLHSLGTELPDEDALRGFSWDDPMCGGMHVQSELGARRMQVHDPYGRDQHPAMPHTAEEDSLQRDSFVSNREDLGRAYFNSRSDSQNGPLLNNVTRESFPEGRPSFEGDSSSQSLAVNPLRHASTHESAMSYWSTFESEEELRHRDLSLHRRRDVDPRAHAMDRDRDGRFLSRASHYSGCASPHSRNDTYYRQIDANLIDVPPPPSPHGRDYSDPRRYQVKANRRPSSPPFARAATDPYGSQPLRDFARGSSFDYDRPSHSMFVSGRAQSVDHSTMEATAIRRQGSADYADGKEWRDEGPDSRYVHPLSMHAASFDSSSMDVIRSQNQPFPQDRQYSRSMEMEVQMRRERSSFNDLSPSEYPPSERINQPLVRIQKKMEAVPSRDVLRPMMKRDTSHQAEKPDVKKGTKMRRGIGREFVDAPSFTTPSSSGDIAPLADSHSFDDAMNPEATDDLMHRLAPSMAEINLGSGTKAEGNAVSQKDNGLLPIMAEARNKPMAVSMADRATTLERLGDLLDDDEGDFENVAWLDEVPPEAV